MEHTVFCTELNGTVTVDPDPLYVKPLDTIKWQNLVSEEYQVADVSPDNPPLFVAQAIVIPAGSTSNPATSKPATIAPSLNFVEPIEYHYKLVPADAGGTPIDPVIIVEAPGGTPGAQQEPQVPSQS